MKIVIAIILLGIAACSLKHNAYQEFLSHDKLSNLNKQSTFEVYSYEEHPFKGWSHSEIQSLLGLQTKYLKDTSNIPYDLTVNDELPENFDARERWPDCIHPIRDQQKCGSCWAFAASEVLSDRFCIASNGTVNVVLSPQDMVSCDYFDHGCNGGILTLSWTYLKLFGIVEDTCKPYTAGDGHVDFCGFWKSKCTADGQTYKKYKAKNLYWLSSIDQIKQSLYNNGPIEVGFNVYDDFISYKSGIYTKTPGAQMLGGHAVKIVGWGKENGVEHWIVANSWNTTWGENGFFRIAFKQCNIENGIAGDPSL
jgi:cathepsin B